VNLTLPVWLQWIESTGTYFIKIDYDLNNGTAFSNTGAVQVLAVPVAMYAERSGDNVWQKNGGDVYRPGGKVGIGSGKPLSPLFVKSGEFGKYRGFVLRSLDAHTVLNNTDVGGSNAGFLQVYSGGNEDAVGTAPYTFLLQPEGGRVGINSFGAASALSLKSKLSGKTGGFSMQSIDAHLNFYYVDNNGGNNPVIQSWAGGNDDIMGNNTYNLLMQPEGGNIMIGTFVPAPANIKLDVNGTTRTKILEITGGDVAEARHTTTGEKLPVG